MKMMVPLLSALALAGVLHAAPAPAPPAPTEADWRVPDPQNLLVIDTSKGRTIVELSPVAAK